MWLNPKKQFVLFVFLGLLSLGIAFLLRNLFLKPSPELTTTPISSPFPSSDSKEPFIIIGNKTLSLEIADTPEKQHQGLAGHAPLTDNQGMLFPYSPPKKVTFWMKGMTFSIDIIYLANDKIIQIYSRVPFPLVNTPDSALERYPSQQPVDYVLETKAGWTEENKIQIGDPVKLFLSGNK